MAQDFRRSKAEAVGTGATLIYTAGASTHNCVVGIGLANILGSPINVSAITSYGWWSQSSITTWRST